METITIVKRDVCSYMKYNREMGKNKDCCQSFQCTIMRYLGDFKSVSENEEFGGHMYNSGMRDYQIFFLSIQSFTTYVWSISHEL